MEPAEKGLQLSKSNRLYLTCGILSAVIYIIADTSGALNWQGYSYTDQAVSELSAIGAPTRPLMVQFFTLYDILLVAFGIGVWGAGKSRSLRTVGVLLIGIAVVGRVTNIFFPMNLREAPKGLTDTMHIILTAVISLFIILSMGFGAGADGKKFRIYSIVSIVVLLLFGFLASRIAPNIDNNLPTPWLGIYERINIFSYLMWCAVLTLVLLRKEEVKLTPKAENVQIPV